MVYDLIFNGRAVATVTGDFVKIFANALINVAGDECTVSYRPHINKEADSKE